MATTAVPLPERVSAEDLIGRARKLIPSLRERAERIAATRSQPPDVVQDLRDAGLMELVRPARFGGPEHGFDTLYRIGRELAKGDGSTAWVYLVTNAHDVFMPLFPAAVQEQYWHSSSPSGASSYAPTGKAAPVKGGFTLTGKWSFCSGIDQAGWVLLGAIVGMLENPQRPDMRYFLVAANEYKVVDDWHVMGLRGTGSKSVVLDGVFVPDERIITFQQIVSGQPAGSTDPTAYSESAWVTVGFSLAAPATGIAQTAYEITVADLQARIQRRDPIFTARKPALQSHLAEASAMIEASDLLFNRSLQAAFGRIAGRVRLTNEERVRNRRDSTYSIVLARKAVDILMGMTGGHGLMETHPVQRALRDLYAISAHPATVWDSPALSYGSVALGGAPTEPMI
jgi:alkylation response protein AidB-like acyl-CoA dehydrogenase